MAIKNRTDLDRAARVLPGVLEHRLAGVSDAQVGNVRISNDSGMSNETVFFDAAWTKDGGSRTQTLVARIAPQHGGIFLDYDIEREFRLMSSLSDGTDLPVPKPLFVEPDPEPLGAPFLVMPFVAGRTLSDDPPYTVAGWLTEVDAEARALVIDNTLRALADVHAVDWRGLGIELGVAADEDAESVIERRLVHEETFFAWAMEGKPHPVIEAGLAWLRANRPSSGPLVLNWGDARISNVIYDDDLNPVSLLDWERATIAGREQDLGWWLFASRHHTRGIGVPEPSGFPQPAQLVKRYEALTGYVCHDLLFYEVLAGVEAASMMVRAAGMLTSAGLLPPENTMALINPASVLLAELIGAAPLDGESISFIGNRA